MSPILIRLWRSASLPSGKDGMAAGGNSCLGRVARGLAGVAVAWMTVAGLAQSQTAEQLLQQADAALQKEEYAAAAHLLETYLAQNPEDYRAEFNLAFAYSLTGRVEEAIRAYRNVLAREKDLTPAHFNLALLLLGQENFTEAADHLGSVIAKQPENATAHLRLAEAYTSLHRLPEARQAYERVLSLKPNDAAVHLAYGKLLATTDLTKAEEHLRSALRLDPALKEARLSLAAVLEERATQGADTLDEAAEIYLQYLDSDPDRADLRMRLGQIYAMQKRHDAAAEQFEAARAGGDYDPELTQALFEVYLESPDTEKYKEKALLLLQEMLAHEGPSAERLLLLGRLWMEKKRYKEAAEQFRQASQLRPESTDGFTNLASALYLLKDYEGTVAALETISRLGKDTPGTYFLRAISLDQLHRAAPALENYQRFLELDDGKNPDQEFQARQRIKILAREVANRPSRGR